MTERRQDIDWEKTTFDGSRREQLRRGRAMSLRQRLEALDQLSNLAALMQAMPRHEGGSASDAAVSDVREQDNTYSSEKPIYNFFLEGCTPTPLASYLKALGILRLVAEQADPDAAGYWKDDIFVLQTALDRDALQTFFLEQYRPTPILAPWNSGSGFYFQEEKLKEKDPATGKRIKTGIRNQPTEATKVIDAILDSSCERLANYRSMTRRCKQHVTAFAFHEAPKGDVKDRLIETLRAQLPDEALIWLDAALLVTFEKTKFPPLLGTGGNDGNLDFTNNFAQRLIELIDCGTGEASTLAEHSLPGSLFGTAKPGQVSAAIGQFSPGGAGGPNGTTGFDSKSSFNPWDFVFMLEGTVLFAAAATRRLESSDISALSYPFTVRTTGSGDGGTALGDEDTARAEIWMPLWDRPTSLDELRSLLSEGRATLHRRSARDGLDFVRAVSQLGVQRGIRAFQRYAFLMRSGKAYLATPLNRVRVERNPAANLINELDKPTHYWLRRFRSLARRKETPARLRSLMRRLEDTLFELSRCPHPRHVQQVLIALGQAQDYLASSPTARESCPPVPCLSAAWSIAADDGSAAFRIAAALAGLHLRAEDGKRPAMRMAAHFAPVDPDGKGAWPKYPDFHTMVWHSGDLSRNLYAVVQRRLLDARRNGKTGKPLAHFATAPLAHVADWLASPAMDTQVDALLRGLVLTRIPVGFAGKTPAPVPLPAALAALKPLFCIEQQLRDCSLLAPDAQLPLESGTLRRIWRGGDDAMSYAARRLRAAGLQIDTSHIDIAGVDSQRLLAALSVPIADHDLKRLLKPLRLPTRNTEAEIVTA